MSTYTVLPQNTFEALQLNAGVLLKNFDPAKPAAPADADILCATTGDIKIVCEPTFTDLGSDVNNCPSNMKELKVLESWKCEVTYTSIGTSLDGLKFALGAADVDEVNGKVTPRASIDQGNDFNTLWWVGDRADGGLVAVKIFNALSTSGLSLTAARQSKGKIAVTLTAHVSLDAQSTIPMEFYSIEPSA